MFNKDKINKAKDATIIEGPEEVLNSNEVNNPNITDNKPPIIEKRTIFCGLSEMFRAMAAGIINICLLYTSPSPRDRTRSRMPSSA